MSEDRVWNVEVVLTEHGHSTRADAILDLGAQHYHGWGRARRNPIDPDRPAVGREIATARALENLAAQLVHVAESDIEAFEGHAVHVYV